MAYWGIALANGPNLNDREVNTARRQAALSALQKARNLAKYATDKERAHIAALATRYPSSEAESAATDPASNYRDAMAQVCRRFPNDTDARVLYAESIMVLCAGRFWNADGSPMPDTKLMVDALECALRQDPNHTGANHYYIHAMEGSPHPERALSSADTVAGHRGPINCREKGRPGTSSGG
jgi:hypothetical protein